MSHYLTRRGFTFIELLLYVAIVALLLVMVINLFFGLGHARMKQQTVAEVEQQGYAAVAQMTQAIRNAKTVSSPTASTASSSLTLSTYTATTSPTTFDLASSSLRVTEGTSTSVYLTSPQVVVTNLSFTNLTASTTEGSVRIQFTISHATSSSRYDSNYSTTFYATASVRNFQ